MPLWFGHGKRLQQVEEGLGTVSKQIQGVDGKIDTILSELEQDETQAPEQGIEAIETPTIPTGTDSYRGKLNAIEQDILACKDPVRLQELFAMEKEVRRWYNARQNARIKKLHPPVSYRKNNYSEPDGEMDDEIEPIAREIGVSPDGKLDPGKFYNGLSGLVKKHPTWAKMIAKQLGIDDLDGALGMLGQVVNDPAKTAELGTLIGTGASGVIKGVLDKFGQKPTQAPQAPAQGVGQPSNAPPQNQMRAPDGFPLFLVGGKVVDPRNPYQVAG